MQNSAAIALVSTIQERCRTCYMCVRECPAKAIRISSGRVEVLAERCIGCGDCVRVCNQRAKRVYDSIPHVNRLLASGEPVAAILASSFPAEFTCASTEQLVGMVRALGFSSVHEASFGGDLVAERYRRLLTAETDEWSADPDSIGNGERRYIAANCPAIVSYVQHYMPDLTASLAPIVSPMVAMGRALKAIHGENIRIVFIGPCIAKKAEILSPNLRHEVDGALTFRELRRMFQEREITLANTTPAPLDPPFGRAGGLYPISRGLLQAANITEDFTRGEVVAADGKSQYPDAI
ncbi:MAG: 4Fe-4S dicluster domain-containing protein, partial [Candidatus Hydrogenedentes bacterium]|nr:4Fe-4S dicluster domain-containing protein [Candidatus Hydrogenedentota bacterium]